MTVIELELPDEQAAHLKAQAQERGLMIGEWIAELSGQIMPRPDRPVDERPIWEILAGSLKDIPPEELALLPKDGASQVDHYVYGLPKRNQ
jgi:hypothetical protein